MQLTICVILHFYPLVIQHSNGKSTISRYSTQLVITIFDYSRCRYHSRLLSITMFDQPLFSLKDIYSTYSFACACVRIPLPEKDLKLFPTFHGWYAGWIAKGYTSPPFESPTATKRNPLARPAHWHTSWWPAKVDAARSLPVNWWENGETTRNHQEQMFIKKMVTFALMHSNFCEFDIWVSITTVTIRMQ